MRRRVHATRHLSTAQGLLPSANCHRRRRRLLPTRLRRDTRRVARRCPRRQLARRHRATTPARRSRRAAPRSNRRCTASSALRTSSSPTTAAGTLCVTWTHRPSIATACGSSTRRTRSPAWPTRVCRPAGTVSTRGPSRTASATAVPTTATCTTSTRPTGMSTVRATTSSLTTARCQRAAPRPRTRRPPRPRPRTRSASSRRRIGAATSRGPCSTWRCGTTAARPRRPTSSSPTRPTRTAARSACCRRCSRGTPPIRSAQRSARATSASARRTRTIAIPSSTVPSLRRASSSATAPPTPRRRRRRPCRRRARRRCRCPSPRRRCRTSARATARSSRCTPTRPTTWRCGWEPTTRGAARAHPARPVLPLTALHCARATGAAARDAGGGAHPLPHRLGRGGGRSAAVVGGRASAHGDGRRATGHRAAPCQL